VRLRLLVLVATTSLSVAGASFSPAVAADPTITISGTVYDENRGALADVTVDARINSDPFKASTTTDAQGRYSVTVPLRGIRAYELEFSKAGGWITRIGGTRGRAGVDVPDVNMQLERYATVSGSISSTKEPISNRSVSFYAKTAGDDVDVRTDANGRFSLDTVVPGRYRVAWEQEDGDLQLFKRFGSYDIVVGSGDTIDLGNDSFPQRPPPGGTVVADYTGVQRDYAALTAWPVVGSTDYAELLSQTVAPGHPVVTIGDLPPGQYKFSLDGRGTWYGGLSEASATPVTVATGQTLHIRAALGPETYVVGLVVNTAGEAVTGLNVEVFRADSPGEVVGEAITTAESLQIGDLPEASYFLRVSDATGEYPTQVFAVPVPPYLDDEYVLQRTTPLPQPYSGPATASASGPTVGENQPGSVCFYPTNGLTGDEVRCGSVDVDARQYEVTGIKPGDYKMVVGHGPYIPLSRPEWVGGRSFASASTVTFAASEHKTIAAHALGDFGYLSGRVMDVNGRALPGMTVLAYAADNPDEILARTYTRGNLWSLGAMFARPYKLKVIDGAGHYATTWVGGPTFDTAQAITPRLFADTVIPHVVMSRLLEATAPPVITGTTQVGSTLTTTTGFWSQAGLTYSYQWLRDGSAIPGATGASHPLTEADGGHRISVRVDGRDAAGARDSTTSLPTATVTAAPPAARGPVLRVRPTVKTTVRRLGGGKVRLTVRYSGKGITPSGRVTVRRGAKTVVSWHRLEDGRFSVTLRRQPKGRIRYTVRYSGSDLFIPVTRQTARVRAK